MKQTVIMFGEAGQGEFHSLLHMESVCHLADCLGNPPEDSQGILFAVQALLCDRKLYFVRVEEEGYSKADYFQGMALLKNSSLLASTAAIGLPGVGDSEIIDAATDICKPHSSILITSQQDLFDYLTSL